MINIHCYCRCKRRWRKHRHKQRWRKTNGEKMAGTYPTRRQSDRQQYSFTRHDFEGGFIEPITL